MPLPDDDRFADWDPECEDGIFFCTDPWFIPSGNMKQYLDAIEKFDQYAQQTVPLLIEPLIVGSREIIKGVGGVWTGMLTGIQAATATTIQLDDMVKMINRIRDAEDSCAQKTLVPMTLPTSSSKRSPDPAIPSGVSGVTWLRSPTGCDSLRDLLGLV